MCGERVFVGVLCAWELVCMCVECVCMWSMCCGCVCKEGLYMCVVCVRLGVLFVCGVFWVCIVCVLCVWFVSWYVGVV